MDLVDRSGERRPHLEAGEKLFWRGSPDPPEVSGVAAEYRLFSGPYFMPPVYGLSFSMIAGRRCFSSRLRFLGHGILAMRTSPSANRGSASPT